MLAAALDHDREREAAQTLRGFIDRKVRWWTFNGESDLAPKGLSIGKMECHSTWDVPATSTIASSDVRTATSMRTATLVLLGVAAVGWSLAARNRPNFSGTWTIVPGRSVRPDEGRPVNVTVFGEVFTAEQTEDTLTIAIDNEKGFEWVYRLDGQVSHNSAPGPTGPQQTSSTTAWSGSELVITTRGPTGRAGKSQSAITTRTLRLNEDGTLRAEASWGRGGAMIGCVYARDR